MPDMTAIQALEIIGNRGLNDYGEATIKSVFKEEYELLRRSLTSPTADEVCEAIKEEFPNSNLVFRNNKFYEGNKVIIMKYDIGRDIKILIPLPPHLITLIGCFYEAHGHADPNSEVDEDGKRD